MNIEQAVLENLKQLPLNQQEEVLNFTQFLRQKNTITTTKNDFTTEQKMAKWQQVISKLPTNSANLPDEALHRDTMYD